MGALGLFPDESDGWVWSAPVTLPQGGCDISLNADLSQQMRVEVSDEQFNLIPTGTRSNCIAGAYIATPSSSQSKTPTRNLLSPPISTLDRSGVLTVTSMMLRRVAREA